MLTQEQKIQRSMRNLRFDELRKLNPLASIKWLRFQAKTWVQTQLKAQKEFTHQLKKCDLCNHSLDNNSHGFDQNDAWMDGDKFVHSGRCSYCKDCFPRPFRSLDKSQPTQ